MAPGLAEGQGLCHGEIGCLPGIGIHALHETWAAEGAMLALLVLEALRVVGQAVDGCGAPVRQHQERARLLR